MDKQSKQLPVAGLSGLNRRRTHRLKGSWSKQAYGPVPASQPALKRDALKQLLAIMGISGLVGAGTRGLIGVGNMARDTQAPGAANFGAQVPEPIMLSRPRLQLKDEREKRAEGGEKSWFNRAAQSLPNISTTKPLGDWWGPAAGIGLGAGAAYGGWKLTDWLLKKEREMAQKRELSQAEKEYREALAGSYKTAMLADEDTFGIDALYADREKLALSWDSPWTATLGTDTVQGFKGGVLAAALIAAGGTGLAAYNWAKGRNQQKLLEKAMKIRARQRQAVSPPPQYVTLEPQKEEDLGYDA